MKRFAVKRKLILGSKRYQQGRIVFEPNIGIVCLIHFLAQLLASA